MALPPPRLIPVDLVPVELNPPQGSFFTAPEMYNAVTGQPGFSIDETARFFFGRSRQWLRQHVRRLVLDGVEIGIPRDQHGWLRWRLYDVERTAHAIAQDGYLSVDELARVIGIVRLVAQNYKYLLPSPVETRIIPRDKEATITREVREMAIETLTRVKDDIDGKPGAQEHHFSLEEVHYRIDLTKENWAKLLELLAPYLAVAQPDKRRRPASPAEIAERAAIREWAKRNGYKVGERGRIPFEIMDKWKADQAANSKKRR